MKIEEVKNGQSKSYDLYIRLKEDDNRKTLLHLWQQKNLKPNEKLFVVCVF